MSVQEVTLSLPKALYEQIKQAAERLRKPIGVVLAEAVAAVAPVIDTAPESVLHEARDARRFTGRDDSVTAKKSAVKQIVGGQQCY